VQGVAQRQQRHNSPRDAPLSAKAPSIGGVDRAFIVGSVLRGSTDNPFVATQSRVCVSECLHTSRGIVEAREEADKMSEYVHRKSLGKALRARGYSSAKSIEIKLSAESATRLRETLLRPDARGHVVSILVDKEDLAASVLWQER
jgi:hypothetical protein